MAPSTRCASASGAPGHRSSITSAAARSSANAGARSATWAGDRPSASGHSPSSPYHHSTRARDSGEVITYFTAAGPIRASSHPTGRTATPSRGVVGGVRKTGRVPGPLERFSAATRTWFAAAFAEPTPAQAGAWDAIGAGRHALVVAPTGSGKTLSAFLWSIDRLLTEPRPEDRTRRCRVLYISPLKALG